MNVAQHGCFSLPTRDPFDEDCGCWWPVLGLETMPLGPWIGAGAQIQGHAVALLGVSIRNSDFSHPSAAVFCCPCRIEPLKLALVFNVNGRKGTACKGANVILLPCICSVFSLPEMSMTVLWQNKQGLTLILPGGSVGVIYTLVTVWCLLQVPMTLGFMCQFGAQVPTHFIKYFSGCPCESVSGWD